MGHPEFFPDVLTGQLAPAGTGLNLYRNGHVVFSGTLSEESLCRILAFLETRCGTVQVPECEHRYRFLGNNLTCCKCGHIHTPSQPEMPECEHCFYPWPDLSVYSDRKCCHCGKMQYY